MVATMSQAISCRLCLKICKDHKKLYDDIEVYEITVKYFDPMFLNLKHHLTSICLECWCKMKMMNCFQLSVYSAKKCHQYGQLLINHSLCRLCVKRCNNITRFLDNLVIYEIVAKYFDSALLNRNDLSGICLKCWSHIYDFYKFQESVIHTQKIPAIKEEINTSHIFTIESEMSEFHKEFPERNHVCNTNGFSYDDDVVKQDSYQIIIKSEVPVVQECSNVDAPSGFSPSEDIIKKEPEFFSRPELELIDVHSESQFSSNDEIPLSGFVVKHIETPSVNKRKCIDKQSPKAHRGSKKRTVTIPLPLDYEYDSSNDSCNQLFKQNGIERKKSIHELDDFIAKWRPTLECVICSASCATFTLLQKHFESEHPTEQCHIFCCQCKFKSQYYIEEHIRFHIDPNTFKCKICDQRNTTRLNLKRHMEYWHKETTADKDTKSLICCECGKTAKTTGALRKHMQRHEAKRKYKCAICDKGFRGRNDLRTHLAGHTQNVACPNCPMTFINVSQMNAHRTKEHF